MIDGKDFVRKILEHEQVKFDANDPKSVANAVLFLYGIVAQLLEEVATLKENAERSDVPGYHELTGDAEVEAMCEHLRRVVDNGEMPESLADEITALIRQLAQPKPAPEVDEVVKKIIDFRHASSADGIGLIAEINAGIRQLAQRGEPVAWRFVPGTGQWFDAKEHPWQNNTLEGKAFEFAYAHPPSQQEKPVTCKACGWLNGKHSMVCYYSAPGARPSQQEKP